MKRIAAAVFLLLCGLPCADAQNGLRWVPLGCYQLTSLSSAQTITIAAGNPTLVSLTVEGESVRMRDDGTAPTASVGLLLPIGGPWPYSGTLSQIQFIQTASSATIDYCEYR